jgi:threonyl-tRNA synthetase
VTGAEIARSISEGLARVALAIEVDGEIRDLSRPIENDASIRILTWNDPEGKSVYWHSSAHLMAEALESMYPGVKFGIGPPIEHGFYYDVDLGDNELSGDDLDDITTKMRELAKRDVPYERSEVSKADALEYFQEKGDEYKLELIEELEDGSITFYEQGDFTDLCRGPHVPSTGKIKYPKVLSLAGAYWRGDENRKQLTRLYGISFPKKSELDEYLERLELARERDHRKLGRELKLFAISPRVGSGLPLWLPKGTVLRETLVDFMRKEQVKRGYQPVVTPHIGRLELYRTSGHYPYYEGSNFPPMLDESGEDGYMLKPMNCPHHIEIYRTDAHSYRDLPLRLAEFGTVYRNEQSGEVSGLTRVRGFTQDDAHIFCTEEQVKDEFKDVIDLTLKVLNALDFHDFKAQISLRDPNDPDKYQGEPEVWDRAEQSIREAAAEMNLEAVEEIGEAAFYGPKLDFMVKDAIGREWQLGTVQLDYNLPDRFDLSYVGEDNEKHVPVMIHRAPFGSLERFIGVLIEHCGGKFPTWLAPTQAMVLPISDDFNEYAESVRSSLADHGFRVEVDDRNETIGYKIRSAESDKVPFMLIVGQKEVDSSSVSVRRQGSGEQGSTSIDSFIEFLTEETALV